jgi:putative GTP pyrophosphokinase
MRGAMTGKESTIEQQYQSLAPTLDRLKTECGYIIEDALRQASIKTHSVLSRVKTLESAKDKISRREKAQSSLDEIDDLLGLRIVCLLRSDIQRIGEIIRSEFEVITEDNKIDGANIEAFGYQSVHFVAKLNASCKGRRYNGLHQQVFEIQLRTVAMDAWATLSHYLDYKNEIDVPKNLRKDFFSLSGLFYLADTHFEMFYEARIKSGENAKVDLEKEPHAIRELNFDTLMAYLQKRYPHREFGSTILYSMTLRQLADCGYRKLEDIDRILERSADAFTLLEEENPLWLSPGANGKHTCVGILRISMAMTDEKFRKMTTFGNSVRFFNYRSMVKPDKVQT